MPISRYDGRNIRELDQEQYKTFLKDRGKAFITYYDTPEMRYPTDEEIESLTLIGHTWSTGDRFYKLASTYYGFEEYWWVIAWYNQTPTEAHVELGDTVYIPTPLERIIDMFDV